MSTLRTSAPSTSNKYYRHTSYGGLNQCLHIKNGSVLPNCVGYVWGAWYEMIGSAPKLSKGNAKTFYPNTSDGYPRSKSPELGAIACWSGTYGHVAIVVGIHSDHITVAQSNYGGVRWEMVNCYKYGSGYKSHGGNTNFQGFILLPAGHKVVVNTNTSTSDGTIKKGFVKGYSNGKKFVTKVALNMRTEPSTTKGKIVKTIAKGKALYYYGYYAYNGNIVWYYVSDGKNEGYVYGGKLNSGIAPYLTNANP